jgi:heptosyltransferase II
MTVAPEAASILVVRYRFIGDTILTVPFLRNLRQAYPQARIDVLVGPRSGEVLAGCPYIDELITFDTTRFHKYDRGEGSSRSFWSYVVELRARKYDTAFLLKRSFSSALLALLIGCRNRIGYSTFCRTPLLTLPVKWDRNVHEVESTLSVLRQAGINVTDTRLEAWISRSEQEELLRLVPELASQKKKILFHAAAAHPDKMYPLANWAKLISEMAGRLDIMPFFAGSKQDEELYRQLAEACGQQCVTTAGKLSLRQSMALLAGMDLSICTDSGPAHLSAATGTPTIALFGPTDPVRWRPWGEQHLAIFDDNLPCRPCHYKKTCQEKRPCLAELDPEIIIEKALCLLAKNTREPRCLRPASTPG